MSDYLLGHHDKEWQRLDVQHALWREKLLGDLVHAGLTQGMRVLDAGCGVGSLLADLAECVGETGTAVGVERDRSAVAVATERFEDKPWVEVLQGDLTAGPLPVGFDFIVCRWVLSFLPSPGVAVSRLAACLAPGGTLVVQDYDHDGVNLFPTIESFPRVIEAFRASYRDSGGDLWVATRLPRDFAVAGLSVTDVLPHAMAGGPSSGAWIWVTRFLREHLEDVITSGHLDRTVATAFLEDLATAEADPHALLVTPLVISVVGRA